MAHVQQFRLVSMILAAGLAGPSAALAAPRGSATPASLEAASQVVPGRYIVVLKKGIAQKAVAGKAVRDVAAALQQSYGGKILRTYEHALEGFVIDLPTEESLSALRADSRIDYVEPDRISKIVATQNNPTWGLDRVDQRNLPLNQTYNYPNQAGSGVHAYVLDTGIYAAHPEFALPGGGSRVIPGVDFVDNDADPDDCHGHGTHVAGTIGSTTYGVAKQVTLHSVRVCDCLGNCPNSAIINGVDYVTNNHLSPAVANMSVGGGFSQAMNTAVTNSIAAGVTYAVAAGNFSSDACYVSPASTPDALTVGGTDSTDHIYVFSDTGTCLDLFAPGVSVTSTWIQPALTNTIDGTSMASPHVAGAAALYLGAHPTESPAQVSAAIIAQATPNVVVNPGTGSPNRLLYTGFLNPPSGPCDGLCNNPVNISFPAYGSYQSGNLGTGAGCFQTTSVVHGGNCGNFASPRTLSVNGVQETCNFQNWSSLPAPRNGGYCVQTTAGSYDWAYFTLWY